MGSDLVCPTRHSFLLDQQVARTHGAEPGMVDWEGRGVCWLHGCIGKVCLRSSRPSGRLSFNPFVLSVTINPDYGCLVPLAPKPCKGHTMQVLLPLCFPTPTSDTLRFIESGAACSSASQHPIFLSALLSLSSLSLWGFDCNKTLLLLFCGIWGKSKAKCLLSIHHCSHLALPDTVMISGLLHIGYSCFNFGCSMLPRRGTLRICLMGR